MQNRNMMNGGQGPAPSNPGGDAALNGGRVGTMGRGQHDGERGMTMNGYSSGMVPPGAGYGRGAVGGGGNGGGGMVVGGGAPWGRAAGTMQQQRLPQQHLEPPQNLQPPLQQHQMRPVGAMPQQQQYQQQPMQGPPRSLAPIRTSAPPLQQSHQQQQQYRQDTGPGGLQGIGPPSMMNGAQIGGTAMPGGIAGPRPQGAFYQAPGQVQGMGSQGPPPFAVASPSKPAPLAGGPGKAIDPSQMPRPQNIVLPTQVFETMRDDSHSIPPSTDTSLAVQDTGCSGPRHIRSSMNSVPQGADILKSSSIPLVMLVQPFAMLGKGDSAIPLVDQRPEGPLRCSGCGAYVCPFTKWSRDGMDMLCCFCGASTRVSSQHFGHVNIDGSRSDADTRPELSYGTVEHVVDGKYQIRDPMAPTYLFLIDCTTEAVSLGVTATVCSSISSLLDSVAGYERARIAIVTFDSAVHFYKFDNGKSVNMVVMGDVNEPFSPLGSDIAVSIKDNKENVRNLLKKIPSMFREQAAESSAGAAIQASIEALKIVGGGRLLAFISSLPHKGSLALRPRESGKPPSEKEALDIMAPAAEGKNYSKLAIEAAKYQVSIDIFALTKGYIDLATLSILSQQTSGFVYRFSPFSYQADSSRFYDDLRWNLTRPQGLEAVGRMRVSSGLAVDSYMGAFNKVGETDIQFPAISCDSTLCIKIVHEDRLREGSNAFFQFATLYSTTTGQRRVRVLTIALPVTKSLGTVFRGADLEVYLSYIARKVSAQIPGRTLAACKDTITKATVDTLLAYRKHCSSSSSSGQLILPESLKLMPLFSLGLMKLPCFRTDSRADARAVWMSRILSMPIDRLLPAVHPRFFAIPQDIKEESEKVSVPQSQPLSAEKLETSGMFLLENGFDLFVLLGRDVSPSIVEQLLGTGSIESIDPSTVGDLPNLNNKLSNHLRRIVAELRRQRRSFMHMRLVKKGHSHETLFLSALVEDRHPLSGMSYVEYLCHLHRLIQNKMT